MLGSVTGLIFRNIRSLIGVRKNANDNRRGTTRKLAAGLIALALIAGWAELSGDEVKATVLSVRGELVLNDRRQIASRSRVIKAESTIAIGDEIRTSLDSVGAISLVPGIFIEAGDETEMEIVSLRVGKEGNAMVHAMKSRFASVKLKKGLIRASLRQFGSGVCQFEVQTSLGTVIAGPGAIFSVRVAPETVRVICVRGETGWTDLEGSSANPTPAGYFRDYGSRRANHFRAASEEPQVEAEILAALDAAAHLDKVALRARYAPVSWRHRSEN